MPYRRIPRQGSSVPIQHLTSAAQATAERQRVVFDRLSPSEKTDRLMKLAGAGRG